MKLEGSPYSKTWIVATQSSSVKLTVESIVRGHHVFKEVWGLRRGDQLCLQIEEFNRYDGYAVYSHCAWWMLDMCQNSLLLKR